jgi:hypothetical protein
MTEGQWHLIVRCFMNALYIGRRRGEKNTLKKIEKNKKNALVLVWWIFLWTKMGVFPEDFGVDSFSRRWARILVWIRFPADERGFFVDFGVDEF